MMGRRDFMKSTLAGFGGLFFLPKIDMKQELRVVEAKGEGEEICLSNPWKDGDQASGDQHGSDEYR